MRCLLLRVGWENHTSQTGIIVPSAHIPTHWDATWKYRNGRKCCECVMWVLHKIENSMYPSTRWKFIVTLQNTKYYLKLKLWPSNAAKYCPLWISKCFCSLKFIFQNGNFGKRNIRIFIFIRLSGKRNKKHLSNFKIWIYNFFIQYLWKTFFFSVSISNELLTQWIWMTFIVILW